MVGVLVGHRRDRYAHGGFFRIGNNGEVATDTGTIARRKRSMTVLILLTTTLLPSAETGAGHAPDASRASVRVATFNIWELSAQKIDEVDDAGRGANVQLKNAAEIVQRVRPDVLLINEIDFDAERRNAVRFRDRYLRVSQGGQRPVDYPFVYFEPVNTGVSSGKDLDNDGKSTGPGDAFGFGQYPGQYGMALFSRFELDTERARTFRSLLWKDMPGHLMPDGRDGRPEWYSPDEATILRLSSKSHWDVPVRVGDHVIHLLCSHPTPPVFDGAEDRNGRRNFDEIRFWADYISGGDGAAYIVDDAGRRGPLPAGEAFLILGDLNADPDKGETVNGRRAIEQLLKHERIQDTEPVSHATTDGNRPDALKPLDHKTSNFGRLDYVLPSRGLQVTESGIFWPPSGDPLHRLVRNREASSDHRLVWIDVLIRNNPE
jgi:endonuclease/exonuclease/phosphatase family metal-dependent hydrolase